METTSSPVFSLSLSLSLSLTLSLTCLQIACKRVLNLLSQFSSTQSLFLSEENSKLVVCFQQASKQASKQASRQAGSRASSLHLRN